MSYKKQLLENVSFKFSIEFNEIYARLMTYWLGNWKDSVWLYNCLKTIKDVIRLDVNMKLIKYIMIIKIMSEVGQGRNTDYGDSTQKEGRKMSSYAIVDLK